MKIKNVSVFNQVRDYLINNFGATTSLANIQSDLESKQGVNIKREKLTRYLQILEDAKVVSKCARFDLKLRKSLRGEQKYYLADLSFYFALNTDNRTNCGPVLENIVYRYALAQGCKVSVGRIGKLEYDFILRNPEMGYAYVQVAMIIMADRATEEREYRPFTQIMDNYPKYLLTRSDPSSKGTASSMPAPPSSCRRKGHSSWQQLPFDYIPRWDGGFFFAASCLVPTGCSHPSDDR